MTIVLFYESDCRNCGQIIFDPRKSYGILKDRHVRVVTVSGDSSPRLYEDTSSRFPWHDNPHFQEGSSSEVFKEWGVAGTPAMFVIDGKGVVKGEYGSLEHIMNLSDK